MQFRNKVILGLIVGVLALGVLAVVSYSTVLKSESDRTWVGHTHLVLETLDELIASLLVAETSERGLIMTGDPTYAVPFRRIDDATRQYETQLRKLTADNPVQQQSLDRLEPLLLKRLAELESIARIAEAGELQAATEAVRAGSKRSLTNQIRQIVTDMKSEEKRLLDVRSREAAASSRQTKLVIVGGNGLALAFLLLAIAAVYQEMKRRRVAEEQIRALNVGLEERVAERTAELADRAKELARSNQELQQFAYVASHDLQEPLRMIASFTQLLAKRYGDKLDDDARDFITYAVDGARRMQTLISDLLLYSRVGTQGKPLEPTDANAVLDRVLDGLLLSIKDSHSVITRDRLPVVMADDIQLGQLFQNLIVNAMKFRGQDAPRIHVWAERNGNTWKFAVQDNGIGIAPEHGDRIFVIFQRLHTKTEYPGTGIGLAICKKIAERHRGKIWFEPSPGGGTIFYFTLTAAETRAAERENDGLRVPSSAY